MSNIGNCGTLLVPWSRAQSVIVQSDAEMICDQNRNVSAGVYLDDVHCPKTQWMNLCRTDEPNCNDGWIRRHNLVRSNGGTKMFCGNEVTHSDTPLCDGFELIRFTWDHGENNDIVRAECGNLLPQGWHQYSQYDSDLACPPGSKAWEDYGLCVLESRAASEGCPDGYFENIGKCWAAPCRFVLGDGRCLMYSACTGSNSVDDFRFLNCDPG